MIRRLALGALAAYKRFISPIMPPACRFLPTCSEYAAEAIEKHGLLRGGTLAAARLARCGPWHPGGYDPLPEATGRLGRPTPHRQRADLAPDVPRPRKAI